MNILQTCIQTAIKENPAAACREVPEIIQHYINDVERLNRVYTMAKVVIHDPSRENLYRLAVAVYEAEGLG